MDQDIETGRQRITTARFMEAGRMVKEVALGFNPEKCKVMHIGHEYTTTYVMEDGGRLRNLDSIEGPRRT